VLYTRSIPCKSGAVPRLSNASGPECLKKNPLNNALCYLMQLCSECFFSRRVGTGSHQQGDFGTISDAVNLFEPVQVRIGPSAVDQPRCLGLCGRRLGQPLHLPCLPSLQHSTPICRLFPLSCSPSTVLSELLSRIENGRSAGEPPAVIGLQHLPILCTQLSSVLQQTHPSSIFHALVGLRF